MVADGHHPGHLPLQPGVEEVPLVPLPRVAPAPVAGRWAGWERQSMGKWGTLASRSQCPRCERPAGGPSRCPAPAPSPGRRPQRGQSTGPWTRSGTTRRCWPARCPRPPGNGQGRSQAGPGVPAAAADPTAHRTGRRRGSSSGRRAAAARSRPNRTSRARASPRPPPLPHTSPGGGT